MSRDERIGVLVMAYGSPGSVADIEPYYTHIRRGRPPEPQQLADLVGRYEAIGGVSPLTARTAAQARALGEALQLIAPDRTVVVQGLKHAAPFIEEGVDRLRDAGVAGIVGLVLAPHFSGGSVGQYHDRARAALAEHGVAYTGIDRWHDLDAWIDFQAAGLTETLHRAPVGSQVLFTAHSLPERVLAGDPYPDELFASASAVADRVGLPRWGAWGLGWQSAGRTADPWRGPDVLDIIDDLAGTGRSPGLVVVPQGFTSDHLEVLYDLDIEARQRAASHGLWFGRTPTLNDDRATFAALARRVDTLARELVG